MSKVVIPTRRSRLFYAIAGAISAGVAAVLAGTGCTYLLFPCGIYGCPQPAVTSLPPQDNLVARELAQSTSLTYVETKLTELARAQYGLLEHRWPVPAQCEVVCAVGCRYQIRVRQEKVSWNGSSEEMGCFILELVVVEGPQKLPVVRRTGEMPRIQCPQP
jgi:hypothetical protein